MKLYHLLFSCFAFASLTSCSSLDKPAKPQNAGPQVKDVAFTARNEADDSIRKRIIVLPFLDATNSTRAAHIAREILVKNMIRSGSVVLIAPTDLPQELSHYMTQNEYDLEAIAKAAAAIGVMAVVEGKVLDVKAKRVGDEVGVFRQVRAEIEAQVRLRVFATKNGKEMLNEVLKANVRDSTTRFAEYAYTDRNLQDDPQLIETVILKAFEGSTKKILGSIEKLNWQGRIALVSGDRIYINAGRLSGIQIGDILKVTEEGEEVFDPQTGLFIGKVPGRMKGTVEVISYFGRDGAISVVHSGSGFIENDPIEIY